MMEAEKLIGSMQPKSMMLTLVCGINSYIFGLPNCCCACYWAISGDELLSDSFRYDELFEGVLWEVAGKVRNTCGIYNSS